MKYFSGALGLLTACLLLGGGCAQIMPASTSPVTVLDSPSADGRTQTVVISDIHMGEERGATAGYCWFTENSASLESFLDQVAASSQIKALVIAGDLFDEWIVPMADQPYQGGITSDEGYFLSVANAPLNKNIVAKLNAIANAGQVQVVYVPGNHDMLVTEAIMKQIVPNIVWAGAGSAADVTAGNGVYWPNSQTAIEHGHRYDFFNAPDPLTRTGSLLPPGYFISRVFATKAVQGGALAEPSGLTRGNLEFALSWDIAIADINVPGLDKNAPIIKTGIDGYTADMSVNGARDNYSPAIGDQWSQRQGINGVYSKISETSAILTGSGIGWWGDLEEAADVEYLWPGRARIAVFGHSHKALIKKGLATLGRIYANTGTWVNEKNVAAGYKTRTYVVISPSVSRGTETDTVSLFQYNGSFEATKLAEASITLKPGGR